jgi:hypothetical protein
MNDPWAKILKPEAGGKLKARLSDADHPYSFWWAKDNQDRLNFLLLYAVPQERRSIKLPTLSGIEISDNPTEEDEEQRRLLLCLKQTSDADIFQHLCLDILNETRSSANEMEALWRALDRTWRWHYLLRGTKDGRLSAERQIGLIGELLFLQEHLLDRFPAANAVGFWTGPERSAKDFVVNSLGAELKSTGSSKTSVSMSSEHQLDTEDLDELILSVMTIDPVDGKNSDGVDLGGLVSQIEDQIGENEISARENFEKKLAEAGYLPEHDYSGFVWRKTDERFYRITSDFPRLIPDNLPDGIENTRYSVNLGQCEDFRIDETDLAKLLVQGDPDV